MYDRQKSIFLRAAAVAWVTCFALLTGCVEEPVENPGAHVEAAFRLQQDVAMDGKIVLREAYLKLDRIQIAGTSGGEQTTLLEHSINPEEAPFRLLDHDSTHFAFNLPFTYYDQLTFHLYLYADEHALTFPEDPVLETPAGGGQDDQGDSGDRDDGGDKDDDEGGNGNKGDKGSNGDQDDKGDGSDKADQDDEGAKGDKGDKDDKGDKSDNGDNKDNEDRGDKGDKGGNEDRGDKGDKGGNEDRGDKDDKGDNEDRGDEGDKGDKGTKGGKDKEKGNGKGKDKDKDHHDKEKHDHEKDKGKGKHGHGHHDHDDDDDGGKGKDDHGKGKHGNHDHHDHGKNGGKGGDDDDDDEEEDDDGRVVSHTVDLDDFFRNAKPSIVVFGVYQHPSGAVDLIVAVTGIEKLVVSSATGPIQLSANNSAIISFDPGRWFESITPGDIEAATIQTYQNRSVLFVHPGFNQSLYEKLVSQLEASAAVTFASDF